MENTKEEKVQATDISTAIKLLENLKTDARVPKERTTQINSTLGALGRVFKDLDPDEEIDTRIKIRIRFKPLSINIDISSK